MNVMSRTKQKLMEFGIDTIDIRWILFLLFRFDEKEKNIYFKSKRYLTKIFICVVCDGTSNGNQAAIKLLSHATRNEFTQFSVSLLCFGIHIPQIENDQTPQINLQQFTKYKISRSLRCSSFCWTQNSITNEMKRIKPHEMVPITKNERLISKRTRKATKGDRIDIYLIVSNSL